MNKIDVIRAWKDPIYRATLSEEQLAALPMHPAGVTELSDDQIRMTGAAGEVQTTAMTCTEYTFLNWTACCPVQTTALTCTEYTFGGMKACCP